MSNRILFPISIFARLAVAMLIPLRITTSIGVTTTQLIASGMIWSLTDDTFQWDLLSLIGGFALCIPALLFCIYFKNIIEDRSSIMAAIATALLLLSCPILGFFLPEWTSWLICYPLGYPVVLIVCFILLPALHQLLRSSGIRVISTEYLLMLVSFVLVIVCPFVFLFNFGVYAQDRTLLSSGLITSSQIRSGWTEESGLYFLGFSSVTELEVMLSSFHIIVLFRVVFLLFIALYLSKRISILGVVFAGVLQELVLLIIAYDVNGLIITQPYYETGASPFPYLFPLLLIPLAIHWKLKRDVAPAILDDEEYIAIPLIIQLQQKISNLKRKLRLRQSTPIDESN